MVRRDLRARYAGSALGAAWSLAHPLAQLALFTFVFSMVIGLRGDPRWPGVGFAVVLFAGLLPWLAVSDAIQRSASAFTDNATLIKKAAFPTESLVVSTVIASLLHTLVGAVVLLGVIAVAHHIAPAGFVVLLVALPLQLLLTVGLSLTAATLNVFFRDVGQALNLLLMLWFYLTPIVYPEHLVPDPWRAWLAWNPLTTLVDLYRHAFLGGIPQWPERVLVLAAWSTVAMLVGSAVFSGLKHHLAEQV
jgi:lipopolysaccharide transport system permease protein